MSIQANIPGVAPITSSNFTFKERVWWVLLYSKENSNPDLKADEIYELLTAGFSIPATRKKIRKALSTSGQNIVPRTLDGKEVFRVSSFAELALKAKNGPIHLIHVTGKKPFTDQAELSKLPDVLGAGPYQVVDKYYGQQSLDFLLSLSSKGSVNFITALPAANESKIALQRAARSLQSQTRNKVLIRLYPNARDLHDRYILSKKYIALVGHGLANFGQKESFVVILDDNVSGGIKNDLTQGFTKKWKISGTV